MLLSFIVPAYNEEKYIAKCLASIKKQRTRHKYELIVVDARSEDRTVEIARKYANRIILSDKKSVAFQRNLGAKAAKGKYLVFVDADTELSENYLDNAISYLANGYSAVSFGFKFDKKTLTIRVLQVLANNFYHMMHILAGFNIAISKSIFFKIGGFKNIVLEDVDISQRLRCIGKTEYVMDPLTITSARKHEKMGVLQTLRYYAELYLYERKPFRKYRHMLKYKGYIHIR